MRRSQRIRYAARYYGTTLVASDRFLQAFAEDANGSFTLDAGEDANGNGMLDTLRDPFKVWFNQNLPPGITTAYIDDWVIYHLASGEVHCSSNERRTIVDNPQWWEGAF